MPTISVAMIVKNEAADLAQCLNTVKDWVDEIIIVDSGSTDNTQEIAEQYGAKFYSHPDWPGFGKQRQRAQQYVTSDYVLWLDAGERVTPELRESIQQAVQQGTPNTVYDIPRLSKNDPNGNFTTASDWYLENASYLRLKNITLSYTFPKQWLQKAQIENARLSLSCENVATITGYSGFDPEVGINGIDQNRYPISRTFSLGLNFNF